MSERAIIVKRTAQNFFLRKKEKIECKTVTIPILLDQRQIQPRNPAMNIHDR